MLLLLLLLLLVLLRSVVCVKMLLAQADKRIVRPLCACNTQVLCL